MEASAYKTTDLGLAAYLAAKNLEFLGCVEAGTNPDGVKQAYFVFKDAKERDELVDNWLTGRAPERNYEFKRKLCLKAVKEPLQAT